MSKAVPFERHTEQYDEWFARPRGQKIFESELAAIRKLIREGRKLEVGVGTGRFAERLGVEYGVDPSLQVLTKARQQGISTLKAVGERLPFKGEVFNTVLIIVTICFLDDVVKALQEARRVLDTEGDLTVGLVTRDSVWGKRYSKKKGSGHRFYRYAEFYTVEEMNDILEKSDLIITNHLSTLSQDPDEFSEIEEPRRAASFEHGFHVIQAIKRNPSG